MGTEAVRIKRAKYLEAGIEVHVHVLICGKILSELHTYLQSMMGDISTNVSLIEQVQGSAGKSAILMTWEPWEPWKYWNTILKSSLLSRPRSPFSNISYHDPKAI